MIERGGNSVRPYLLNAPMARWQTLGKYSMDNGLSEKYGVENSLGGGRGGYRCPTVYNDIYSLR